MKFTNDDKTLAIKTCQEAADHIEYLEAQLVELMLSYVRLGQAELATRTALKETAHG